MRRLSPDLETLTCEEMAVPSPISPCNKGQVQPPEDQLLGYCRFIPLNPVFRKSSDTCACSSTWCRSADTREAPGPLQVSLYLHSAEAPAWLRLTWCQLEEKFLKRVFQW